MKHIIILNTPEKATKKEVSPKEFYQFLERYTNYGCNITVEADSISAKYCDVINNYAKLLIAEVEY